VLAGHVFALRKHGYRICRFPVLTLDPTKLPRPLERRGGSILARFAT
jgi:hypothetical protein